MPAGHPSWLINATTLSRMSGSGGVGRSAVCASRNAWALDGASDGMSMVPGCTMISPLLTSVVIPGAGDTPQSVRNARRCALVTAFILRSSKS